jgi:hypothetical protein
MMTFKRVERKPKSIRFTDIRAGEFFRSDFSPNTLYLKLNDNQYTLVSGSLAQSVGIVVAAKDVGFAGELYVVDVTAEISDHV